MQSQKEKKTKGVPWNGRKQGIVTFAEHTGHRLHVETLDAKAPARCGRAVVPNAKSSRPEPAFFFFCRRERFARPLLVWVWATDGTRV